LTAADDSDEKEIFGGSREEGMPEYFAYAALGLLVIGCLLYVTLSPEVEEPPAPKGPRPQAITRDPPPTNDNLLPASTDNDPATTNATSTGT
jgi:hypothetical protein